MPNTNSNYNGSFDNSVGVQAGDSAQGINAQFGSNPFFTAGTRKLPIAGSSIPSCPILLPNGSGLVDVTNNMMWKNWGSVDEVPSVIATEFELDYGQWTQNLANLVGGFSDLFSQKKLDVYQNIYRGNPTGFKYNFPWLLKNGDNIRNVKNTWGEAPALSNFFTKGDTQEGKQSKIADIVGAGIGATISYGSAGIGFEEINEFKSTDSQSLQVSFPLYNTYNPDTAFMHYSFVQLFTFQNLKSRTSLMTYVPPKLYTVSTQGLGGVYLAAAYVSDLKIDSIGTTRSISEFNSYGSSPILIPEAYKVTITFTDLLSQSSNIFAGTMGGSQIQVIGNVNFLNKKNTEQIALAGANGFSNGIVDQVQQSGFGSSGASISKGFSGPIGSNGASISK
jgi:hypothetical protein